MIQPTLDFESPRAPLVIAYGAGVEWPNGVGVPMTEGLWRKRVKGFRGATPKPGSMTEYIRERGLLPSGLIDAIAELTPTHHFTAADFEREGIANWQEWIERICSKAERAAA